MAVNTNNIDLDDEYWFKNVAIPEKSSLTETSVVTLPVVTTLFRLHLMFELLFSIVLVGLIYRSHVWIEEYQEFGLFAIYIPAFLSLWLLRWLLVRKKYGFNYKECFEVSKNKLTLICEPLYKRRRVTLDKSEIESIEFNYGYVRQTETPGKHKRQTHVSAAHVFTKSGEQYEIKPNTIAVLDLLYLCKFFDYPIRLKQQQSQVFASVFYILIHFPPLVGNVILIGFYLYWLLFG